MGKRWTIFLVICAFTLTSCGGGGSGGSSVGGTAIVPPPTTLPPVDVRNIFEFITSDPSNARETHSTETRRTREISQEAGSNGEIIILINNVGGRPERYTFTDGNDITDDGRTILFSTENTLAAHKRETPSAAASLLTLYNGRQFSLEGGIQDGIDIIHQGTPTEISQIPTDTVTYRGEYQILRPPIAEDGRSTENTLRLGSFMLNVNFAATSGNVFTGTARNNAGGVAIVDVEEVGTFSGGTIDENSFEGLMFETKGVLGNLEFDEGISGRFYGEDAIDIAGTGEGREPVLNTDDLNIVIGIIGTRR